MQLLRYLEKNKLNVSVYMTPVEDGRELSVKLFETTSDCSAFKQ